MSQVIPYGGKLWRVETLVDLVNDHKFTKVSLYTVVTKFSGIHAHTDTHTHTHTHTQTHRHTDTHTDTHTHTHRHTHTHTHTDRQTHTHTHHIDRQRHTYTSIAHYNGFLPKQLLGDRHQIHIWSWPDTLDVSIF